MKEKLHQSKYTTVLFEKENNILVQLWNEASEDMSHEENKTEMLALLHALRRSQCVGLLVDATRFKYIISPEMQEWVNQNIFMDKQHAVKGVAIVLTKHFITGLSIKQALDEERPQGGFITRYFELESEARIWLSEIND